VHDVERGNRVSRFADLFEAEFRQALCKGATVAGLVIQNKDVALFDPYGTQRGIPWAVIDGGSFSLAKPGICKECVNQDRKNSSGPDANGNSDQPAA